ncbi:hypothetical protein BGW39_000500 [Mortierella sp. 14UC]|nr:hypothetical protein BGW39_000500 [Mortierella sp. 14UC]
MPHDDLSAQTDHHAIDTQDSSRLQPGFNTTDMVSPTASTTLLSTLPPEIVFCIMSSLGPREILILAQVSSKMRLLSATQLSYAYDIRIPSWNAQSTQRHVDFSGNTELTVDSTKPASPMSEYELYVRLVLSDLYSRESRDIESTTGRDEVKLALCCCKRILRRLYFIDRQRENFLTAPYEHSSNHRGALSLDPMDSLDSSLASGSLRHTSTSPMLSPYISSTENLHIVARVLAEQVCRGICLPETVVLILQSLTSLWDQDQFQYLVSSLEKHATLRVSAIEDRLSMGQLCFQYLIPNILGLLKPSSYGPLRGNLHCEHMSEDQDPGSPKHPPQLQIHPQLIPPLRSNNNLTSFFDRTKSLTGNVLPAQQELLLQPRIRSIAHLTRVLVFLPLLGRHFNTLPTSTFIETFLDRSNGDLPIDRAAVMVYGFMCVLDLEAGKANLASGSYKIFERLMPTQGVVQAQEMVRIGSQPYTSTLADNHDGSVIYTSRDASFSRAPTVRSVSSRFQLHQVDNDNDDDEDDDYEDEDGDDAASAMQPILQTKAAARPRPVKRSSANGQRADRCEQKVYLEEEDIELTFTGYRFLQTRLYIYYLACVLSGGILFLLGRWMPQRYLAFVAEKCEMSQAESVVVEDAWGQLVTEVVFTKYYGGPINSVFSPEQMEKQGDDEGFDEALSKGMLHDMRYFDYQYIRFIFNPLTHSFMQNSKWKDPEWSNVVNCDRGIGRETQQERTMVFGQNVIDVKEKTVGQLLVQEVLHPFYIFQVFSMALWLADDYIYYAGCIFVISTVSVLTELIETKRTMKRMRTMSKFICNVKVFRSGRWRYLGSEELVPGDVFETTDSDLSVFPCDAVLLTGDCIVNESMLTGESVPVSKIPITDKALQQLDLSLANIPSDLARHFLFSGTKIIRARPGPANPKKQARTDDVDFGVNQLPRGLALVVRTGFNTTKGSLIRSMLFPKPNDFQFYRDSFRFIGILAGIAFCGFLVSTVNFIRMDVPFRLMIIKALDLITIVVPPALPATMSIGTSFAIARLKRSNIFCISPTRVNIGGKINCMCFDKTGTLTEDGLDVLGVQCANAETGRFGTLLNCVEDLRAVPDSMQERGTSLLLAMATCHSVKSLNGELIGDPLDLKMFDFTQWILEEGGLGARTSSVSEAAHNQSKGIAGGIVSTVVRPPGAKQFNLNDVLTHHPTEMSESETFLELGIIRCFEFVSSLRRMSVIVKKLHSPGMDIYVKGAPEAMTDICLKESLPSNYAERLSYYTQHGYRVIACATKSMPNLNFVRAQRVKREQVESDLTFLGLIVFENKLKPTTAPIIATLANAQIRQVMCTGDNVLTAISVSKECGLIHQSKEVYTPRFIMGDSTTENSRIIWENTSDERKTLDPMSLMPVASSFETISSGQDFPRYTHLLNDYALAVTGDCFRWMVDFAPKATLHRMLVKGQIFARMSPDEKHELVENLQAIGYCVGFCGDGANDCGALKAADVGISLSEAEASVAAPFTSRSNDIGCVVKVIQEGRAALVTSFSCFKYMALYSIIQFTTVSLLYAFASNLGDFQFLYIDLALILPIAVFMGRTEAFPVLSPKRPTANLVSKKVLTSLIGQIVIQGCFQATLFSIVRHQPWYKPPKYERGEKNIEGFENTSLFLLSIFQYLLVAIVFSVGPPYRKPMSSNRPFVFITAGLVSLSASMVLFPSEWLKGFMQLLDIPFSFKLFILLLAGLHLVIALTSEHVVFPVLATKIGQVIQSIRKQSFSSSSSPLSVPATTARGTSTSQRDSHRRSAQYGDEARIEVGGEEDEQGSGPSTPLIGSDSQNPFDQIGRKEGLRKGKIYKVVQEEMSII